MQQQRINLHRAKNAWWRRALVAGAMAVAATCSACGGGDVSDDDEPDGRASVPALPACQANPKACV